MESRCNQCLKIIASKYKYGYVENNYFCDFLIQASRLGFLPSFMLMKHFLLQNLIIVPSLFTYMKPVPGAMGLPQ